MCKGYVNDQVFHYWGCIFPVHLKRLGLDNKHKILIMDGHGSHIHNLPFIYDMYQNNITVAVLESHTTHAMQPIDKYPFETFKTHFNDLLEQCCANNEGIPLPKACWKFSNDSSQHQGSIQGNRHLPTQPKSYTIEKICG